jgi:hypothetical protein
MLQDGGVEHVRELDVVDEGGVPVNRTSSRRLIGRQYKSGMVFSSAPHHSCERITVLHRTNNMYGIFFALSLL